MTVRTRSSPRRTPLRSSRSYRSEYVHLAIQRCEFEDRPEIKVSKPWKMPDGTTRHMLPQLSKLSLGQQQSILFNPLVLETAPLVIDQPEDDLDGEFVYTTLVGCAAQHKEPHP